MMHSVPTSRPTATQALELFESIVLTTDSRVRITRKEDKLSVWANGHCHGVFHCLVWKLLFSSPLLYSLRAKIYIIESHDLCSDILGASSSPWSPTALKFPQNMPIFE
jgi:hypothetical protein